MRRFFFDLCGQENVQDPKGLPFESGLAAFLAAQRLARDISDARPLLRGNTYVAVTCKGSADAFYVGI